MSTTPADIRDRVRSGLLPTPDEWEILRRDDPAADRNVGREWMAALHRIDRTATEEEWRRLPALLAPSTPPDVQAFVDWFRALPDNDEELAMLDVVREMYMKVVEQAYLGLLRGSDSFTREAKREFRKISEAEESMWNNNSRLWFSYRGLPFINVGAGDNLRPHDGDYLIMHTRNAKSEGIMIKTCAHVLVGVTAVTGPFNVDPTNGGSVHFEPGSRTVQALLAYERGMPTGARLMQDIMALRLVRAAQKAKGPRAKGYRRDGKPTVPLVPFSGFELWKLHRHDKT